MGHKVKGFIWDEGKERKLNAEGASNQSTYLLVLCSEGSLGVRSLLSPLCLLRVRKTLPHFTHLGHNFSLLDGGIGLEHLGTHALAVHYVGGARALGALLLLSFRLRLGLLDGL